MTTIAFDGIKPPAKPRPAGARGATSRGKATMKPVPMKPAKKPSKRGKKGC